MCLLSIIVLIKKGNIVYIWMEPHWGDVRGKFIGCETEVPGGILFAQGGEQLRKQATLNWHDVEQLQAGRNWEIRVDVVTACSLLGDS